MITPKVLTKLSLIIGVSVSLIGNELAQANYIDYDSSSHVIAQNFPAQNSTSRLRFRLPSRGAPVGTIGGATRGGGNKVRAIIPPKGLGLTVSDTPTLFVYLPDNESSSANLIVYDETDEEIYNGVLSSVQTEGILMVKLPEELNLIEGNSYQWLFTLVDDQGKKISKTARGWVEKVPLNDNLKKVYDKNVEPWTAINILAEEGIWQDTLEQLAMLQVANPEDAEVKQEWTELLKSVGLNNVADSEIIPNIVEVEVQ